MRSTTEAEPVWEIKKAFGRLLPTGVLVRVASVEAASGSTNLPAAAKRRDVEHRTGRRLAMAALGDAGSKAVDIAVGKRGMPLWPPGFTGSVTHTRELCAVVLAGECNTRSIGIDIERVEDVEPALASLILRADEAHGRVPLGWVFSAKESVFKCQYPLTGEDAEFTDCRIVWDSDGSFRVEVEDERFAVAREFRGAAVQVGPYVLSAACLSP